MPTSNKVWHNSFYKAFQGLRVQKPEHEMGHTHFMKSLQFADHFRAISSHEVLVGMAYHLSRRRRDTCCTHRGQFDVRRIPTYSPTVVFSKGDLSAMLG